MADAAEDTTVNWKAAQDFFTKGAEDTENEAEEQDEDALDTGTDDGEEGGGEDEIKVRDLVEISIRGKRVRVTKEAAEAYREYINRVRDRDSRHGGEISKLRENLARLEGRLTTGAIEPTIQAPSPPDPSLARTNWEAYHQQLVAYQNALIATTKLELQQAYQNERTRESEDERRVADNTRWVRGFFSQFEELNDPNVRGIVQAVYSEHGGEIDSLATASTQEAYDRLAELTNERLVALTVRGKQVKEKVSGRRHPPKIEGGGSASQHKDDSGSHGQPFSVSKWQQDKRAMMRGDKRFDRAK